MYLTTKIYLSYDEYELAKNYASILAFNFPQSEWYERSYNLLNGLNDVIENENWYEKFNPIRIFKQEKIDDTDISLIKSIE